MPGRPGAGMSAGMRNVPLLVRKKKRNVDTSQQELRGAAMDIFGPNKGDREDVAAMILQRAVIRKLIGHNATFGKEKLIERLHLELKLMRGLRLLALCLCMFVSRASTPSLFAQTIHEFTLRNNYTLSSYCVKKGFYK